MLTTLGRELVRRELPDDYKEWADKPLNKANITELTTKLALKDPDAYVDILKNLSDIGEGVVSTYGRDAALSYKEIAPGKAIQALRAQLKKNIDQVLDDSKLTEEQKEQKIMFCLTAAAASIVLALWGFAWTLEAASTGTLSVLHLGSLIGGMLMARVFTRIAYRA